MDLPRITNAERVRRFGPACAPANMVRVEVWGHRPVVHRAVEAEFVLACERAHRYLNAIGRADQLPRRIDSYNCRNIAGTNNRSLHAWGLAWDIFRTPPGVPPPGGVYTPVDRLHPLFVQAFEELGFVWGGRFRRPDEPHFEWAARPPRS